MNKIDLKNKIAVVTGGAQGFGLAISKRFIESGATVVIWDIDSIATKDAIKIINSKKCYFVQSLPYLAEQFTRITSQGFHSR